MPSTLVVIVCLFLALLGFTVAMLASFRLGQAREENRARRYLSSLSHLYRPEDKDRTRL